MVPGTEKSALLNLKRKAVVSEKIQAAVNDAHIHIDQYIFKSG